MSYTQYMTHYGYTHIILIIQECTNQIQVIRKVTEKKQPDILRKLHRYVRTFIELCIERDPKKRPSAGELIKHPFLTYMDDLKNKQPVSDFVLTENKAQKYYKSLERKEDELNTNNTKNKDKLSMIPEDKSHGAGSKSPSPRNERDRDRVNANKKGLGENRNSKTSKKIKSSKKKYVSGTTVSIEDGGNILVKLKIHHGMYLPLFLSIECKDVDHNLSMTQKTQFKIKCFSDKESQKVKFEYNPQTENITSVVKEMVETLELDQTREHEILRSIQHKLDSLDTSPRPSTPMHASKKSMSTSAKPPSSNISNNQNDKPSTQFNVNDIKKSISQQPPPPLNPVLINNPSNSSQAQTLSSPARDRPAMNMFEFTNNNNGNQSQNQQRPSTQPIDPNNNTQQRPSNGHGSYTEPQSASANPPNQPPPTFYSEPPTGNNQNQQGQFEQNLNHFPKVFNSNGTVSTAVTHQQQTNNNNNNNPNSMLPITSMLSSVSNNNQRQLRSTMNTNPLHYVKSAPVTPGQSPENEKKMGIAGHNNINVHRGGYVSDTGSDYVPPRQMNNNKAQNQGQPASVPQPGLADNISDHSNATNATNATNTTNTGASKVVNDSLLDQIMALPRETIKARIIQFGGSYNDEDGTGILVTKLFQLLSANDSKPSKHPSKPSTQRPSESVLQQPLVPINQAQGQQRNINIQQPQPPPVSTNALGLGQGLGQILGSVDMDVSGEMINDENTQLIMHHVPSTNSIQNVGSQHNLQNLNVNTMNNMNNQSQQALIPPADAPQAVSLHSYNPSNASSAHPTPPNTTMKQQTSRQYSHTKSNTSNSQNVSISPPNELIHPPPPIQSNARQASTESVKSNHSHHSYHSQHSQHTDSPKSAISPKGNHARSHSHNSSNASNHSIPQIVDDASDEEIDPNIQLPKLRVRQKELMKAKIQSQMQKLKERNPTHLGRDNKLDNIASELAEVEKQIKILTDASKKTEKTKIAKNKKSIRESSNPEKDIDNKNKKKSSSTKNSRPPSVEPETASNHPSTFHSRNNSAESQKVTPPRNSKQQDTNNVNVRPKPQKQPFSQLPIINDKPDISMDHSVVTTKSNTNSVSNSMILENTEELSINGQFHISSPLVNPSHRDEFDSHLRHLPKTLDLSDIAGDLGNVNVYINSLFNKSQSNLKAVSDDVLNNAKDRAIREKRQLEEEYKQYYADQTEMLLLKLQKHKRNHQKCAAETQSTHQKLQHKQSKQRTKFKSIVQDQLQILQLTQELNDDGSSVPAASVQSPLQKSAVPPDEFYLYKTDMEQIYLEKVKEFEAKQKRELDAFRTDLKQLNELRLEVKKRSLVRISMPSGHGPGSAATSPKRGSPARIDHNDEGRLFGFNLRLCFWSFNNNISV